MALNWSNPVTLGQERTVTAAEVTAGVASEFVEFKHHIRILRMEIISKNGYQNEMGFYKDPASYRFPLALDIQTPGNRTRFVGDFNAGEVWGVYFYYWGPATGDTWTYRYTVQRRIP